MFHCIAVAAELGLGIDWLIHEGLIATTEISVFIFRGWGRPVTDRRRGETLALDIDSLYTVFCDKAAKTRTKRISFYSGFEISRLERWLQVRIPEAPPNGLG